MMQDSTQAVVEAALAWAATRRSSPLELHYDDDELALIVAVRTYQMRLDDDEYPPAVEYPDGHSPFCTKDCRHPCHTPYDEWAARRRELGQDPGGG